LLHNSYAAACAAISDIRNGEPISPMTTSENQTKREQIVAEARRDQSARQKSYRERALKMFPWVCGRCGREFTGRRVRELTVHHKDHNHDNNPPDGSNWELLCIYCHDNEHAREQVAEWYQQGDSIETQSPPPDNKPFAGLADLLQKTATGSEKDQEE